MGKAADLLNRLRHGISWIFVELGGGKWGAGLCFLVRLLDAEANRKAGQLGLKS